MSEPGILPSPVPFGKYYLLERINVGGMAEVYKAKTFGEEGFEKILAVKKILASIAEDEAFINMFIDEAKITGRLSHPNIAQVFDLGKVEGSYFIAMEYIGGKDLKTIFERSRRLGEIVSIPRICFEMLKACEGLAHAHEKNDAQGNPLEIVHRDISPQNILISYQGEVKIIDFGIAKASGKTSQTQVGILKGKFSYMSPEQVRGLHVDHRSDIFSLGIVMYELLTLERLFLGESDFDTLEKIRKVEMSPPSLYNPHIPAELEKICLKALAKSSDERFQDAHEFSEALEKFMRNQGYYFSNKDLAGYMKEAFSADIEFENKKFEYYKSLNLQPIKVGMPQVEPVATSPSRGLSWGEEEMETQIFDRDDEEIPENMVLSSNRPTVEYDRWDENDMPFVDNAPNRTIQATEQMQAVAPPSTVIHPNTSKPKKSNILLIALITVFILGAVAVFVWMQIRSNKLVVTTEPSSVEIWINGDMVYDGETPYEASLPTGPTILELKREGYETFVKKLDVKKGTGYNLKQNLIAIGKDPDTNVGLSEMMVKTNPPGATIEINNKKFDQVTPFTFKELGKGPYKIKISKEGFFAEERTLEKISATGLDISLKPTQISLAIDSKPNRSSFWVYEVGKKKSIKRGKTPETLQGLDASKQYRIVVKRADFEIWEEKFEPGKDKDNTIKANLTRKSNDNNVTAERISAAERRRLEKQKAILAAKKEKEGLRKEKLRKEKEERENDKPVVSGTGLLYVQSNPVARVYIDGKDTGRYTPLLKFKISAGKKHRVKLVNAEFGLSKTYYIKVKAGKKKKIVNK